MFDLLLSLPSLSLFEEKMTWLVVWRWRIAERVDLHGPYIETTLSMNSASTL